jgi:hypothetical protein
MMAAGLPTSVRHAAIMDARRVAGLGEAAMATAAAPPPAAAAAITGAAFEVGSGWGSGGDVGDTAIGDIDSVSPPSRGHPTGDPMDIARSGQA